MEVVTFMFVGPERHLRIHTSAKPKPTTAICGAEITGFQSSPGFDSMDKNVQWMEHACDGCKIAFDQKAREMEW